VASDAELLFGLHEEPLASLIAPLLRWTAAEASPAADHFTEIPQPKTYTFSTWFYMPLVTT
jgi:hypothetical protein